MIATGFQFGLGMIGAGLVFLIGCAVVFGIVVIVLNVAGGR